MRKIFEKLLGVVFVNKVLLAIAESKRNRFFAVPAFLVKSYVSTFDRSEGVMRFYMVMAVAINVFMFDGIVSFLVVSISDAYLLRSIVK